VKRLLVFADPFADAQGAGYQPIQMMAAIADGNRGLGNGIAKMGYLPTDTSDAIFAIVCEEMGVAGAALVLGVYVVMLWTAVGVMRDCRAGPAASFGRLLTLAVIGTVGLQALMNIAVVTVVVPTKGIALPLLSSGGTGWVLCAAAIGLVAAVDRMNRRHAEATEAEPRRAATAKPIAPPGLSAVDDLAVRIEPTRYSVAP
jgi:cell division protein FtsW